MLRALRRSALALMLLVWSAEAGLIGDTLNKVYSSVFGPACGKKCIARAHALAEMLINECDEDKNGFLSRKEWAGFMERLHQSTNEATHEREYQIFCERFESKLEDGVPGEKMKWVFVHDSWRKPLERWAGAGEL
uniref:EF-hand domain-containing protein n=1 Tax=Alexandrium catenella TaxID=2925 RepID=A0A7S1WXB9_ALECA|mmetsp:Transcript_97015/g.257777  ORF Transcript_97015/g.257777 Transcript_97015/m.257777 type:complete len:135 (+) Transcript_97015:89-493(+)|eukprot:CAMPEP_0171203318 /NCGR_PEP_ID=MMETSP0790-20130122/25461_1 /TAXON_ID=2925 /ORGANISM="Alexandrium catenella, Strain OF101" /LENGTH=134 /DNA_ID=CAMNT_0011668779 /DNA_START=89 /DNA_END=493 /DNA_ORIENTATION=+